MPRRGIQGKTPNLLAACAEPPHYCLGPVFQIRRSSGYVQGKEEGASISVGGEQVKLGIPGGDSLREMAAELTIPMKRIGTPQEAAGAMLLLCLPYASFITGQSLEVTGGAYV